jgi:hypothetical protein
VPLRPRSDRPTYRREIEEPGERNAQEQISASRSNRTRVLLVALDEALVRVAFRLIRDTTFALVLLWEHRCRASPRYRD